MASDSTDLDSSDESIRKLDELIRGIHFAMLTTLDSDGNMHSRPMATQQTEFDGTLWFLTSDTTAKFQQLAQDQRVSINYMDPDENIYVTVTGRAERVHDQGKLREIWSPLHKAWFPKGVDDPHLALIKVQVEQAEYWDVPSSSMVRVLDFAKAVAAGEPHRPGENKKLDLTG